MPIQSSFQLLHFLFHSVHFPLRFTFFIAADTSHPCEIVLRKFAGWHFRKIKFLPNKTGVLIKRKSINYDISTATFHILRVVGRVSIWDSTGHRCCDLARCQRAEAPAAAWREPLIPHHRPKQAKWQWHYILWVIRTMPYEYIVRSGTHKAALLPSSRSHTHGFKCHAILKVTLSSTKEIKSNLEPTLDRSDFNRQHFQSVFKYHWLTNQFLSHIERGKVQKVLKWDQTTLKPQKKTRKRLILRAAFNPCKTSHNSFLNGIAGALNNLLCDRSAGNMLTSIFLLTVF